MGKPIPVIERILPARRTGSETNTETSVRLADAAEAKDRFKTVSERLINVNNWHSYAGKGTAAFQLRDANGRPVNRPAQKGDYFQIDVPGPGTVAGRGDDWVKVAAFDQGEFDQGAYVYFTVNVASSPLNKDPDTAHFFHSEATSTFAVYQHGLTVVAGVYGRNEAPNTDVRTIFDKLRNSLVAIGAMLGFSKVQWKSLTHGLIHYKE